MQFWFTTHWPPREDEPVGRTPNGVWVPDGMFGVVRALARDDHVWIYEAKGGPAVKRSDGSCVRSRRGRMGVIALVKATETVMERPGSTLEEYVERPAVWWRYHAETRPLNTAGYIPMSQAAALLGHSPNFNFRGYARGAGISEIDAAAHARLLDAFVASSGADLAARRAQSSGRAFGGPGGEGEPHREMKERIAADPAIVLREPGLRHVETEMRFATGDRADVVLEDRFGRLVAVEVEVDCGPDEVCGPLQCMKYRGLLAYRFGRDPREVRMVLAARSVHPDVRQRCRRYEIEVVVLG